MSVEAAALLDNLRERGIRVEPRANGNLYAAPRERLTSEVLAAIRRHKVELLALLASLENQHSAKPEPAEPCRVCYARGFWRGDRGPWVCSTCHPPAVEPVARVELPSARAAWLRSVVPDSRNPLIAPEVRAKIEAVETEARRLGWPAELLWSGGYWDSPRGLAALLDPEDEIAEVAADFIAILKTRRDLLRFRRHVA